MKNTVVAVRHDGTKIAMGAFDTTEKISIVADGLRESGLYKALEVTTVAVWELSTGVVDKPEKKPEVVKSFTELKIDTAVDNYSTEEKLKILDMKLTSSVAGDKWYIRQGIKFLYQGAKQDCLEYVDMAMDETKEKARKALKA